MDETIDTRVGAAFDIAVEATPTAGYRWEAAVGPGDGIELVGDEIEPPPAGVGGTARWVFHFRARREGVALVRLRYRRPWEEQVTDERGYTVRVRPA